MTYLAFRASAFPGDYAVTLRVQAAHPHCRLDFNDTVPTHLDADGEAWCVVSLRDDEAIPELIARHGQLALRISALVPLVASLSDAERYPRTAQGMIDYAAVTQRVEAVIGGTEVLPDDVTDPAAVLAEQGEQDVLIVLEAIPDDWTQPEVSPELSPG